MNFKPLSDDLKTLIKETQSYIKNDLKQEYLNLIIEQGWKTADEANKLTDDEVNDLLVEADYRSWLGLDCGFNYIRITNKTDKGKALIKEINNIYRNLKKDNVEIPVDVQEFNKLYGSYTTYSDHADLWANWTPMVQSIGIKGAGLRPLANRVSKLTGIQLAAISELD